MTLLKTYEHEKDPKWMRVYIYFEGTYAQWQPTIDFFVTLTKNSFKTRGFELPGIDDVVGTLSPRLFFSIPTSGLTLLVLIFDFCLQSTESIPISSETKYNKPQRIADADNILNNIFQ